MRHIEIYTITFKTHRVSREYEIETHSPVPALLEAFDKFATETGSVPDEVIHINVTIY